MSSKPFISFRWYVPPMGMVLSNPFIHPISIVDGRNPAPFADGLYVYKYKSHDNPLFTVFHSYQWSLPTGFLPSTVCATPQKWCWVNLFSHGSLVEIYVLVEFVYIGL